LGDVEVGMAEDLSQRLKLSFDVDLCAPRKYAVTLIRAGDTLHGWRSPAEVLRAAVPRFEGASCFVDHVGWFQQAASLGDLVGVISEVGWNETEAGLPVPNVGLSADMLAGYYVEGDTRVATEIRSVYSVDAVFASLARGRSSWHAPPHPVLPSPDSPTSHRYFG